MMKLFEISRNLLTEQDDSKLMMIKKSITKRMPITIDYRGPSPEVKSGVRYDIEPIVLGSNAKSGNLVIWAYVYSGTSKKGLPDWKMFRVDRIKSIKFNPTTKPFNVNDLPEYQRGKAPNAMKSLSDVITFSPYWYDDKDEFKVGRPPAAKPIEKPEVEPISTEPTDVSTQPTPISTEPTDVSTQPTPTPTQPVPTPNINMMTSNPILSKVQDMGGQKYISQDDYEKSAHELYKQKEGEWKNYQRNLSGNVIPGEGTRRRFDRESRTELDNILRQNNINVNNPYPLSETTKRFKFLIN